MRLERHRRGLLPVILVAALLSIAPPALAVDGDLDTTFDTDGKVTTSLGSGEDRLQGLVRQPDGKIVGAGYSYQGAVVDFAVARYNADGSLDTSFDGDGTVTTLVGASYSEATSLIRQPDGKIVAAGYATIAGNSDFALVRYNPDGSLDSSFDGDGKVTTAVGPGIDTGSGIAIQADGKLVVGGYASNGTDYDFAAVRYNTDGSLDTSFDGDGIATTPIGLGYDAVGDVTIQPDGKIILAGSSRVGTDDGFALARFDVDGSLDTTFDGDGTVTTQIGASTDSASAVTVEPDGSIVAAGYSVGTNADFAVARYNPDGSLDTSFDGDGVTTTPIGTISDIANAVAVLPGGRILAAGYAQTTDYDFALVRYEADGSLDATFGTGGKVKAPIGSGWDLGYGMAVQPDGNVVVGGTTNNGTDFDIALARFVGTPADLRPDGQIKFSSEGSYSGDGVYNANGSGQSRSDTVPRRHRARFDIVVEFRGSSTSAAWYAAWARS